MRYWLLKSEPDCFGILDLKKSPKKTTHWDGVRNYQARNFLRDDFAKGDLALFYHSGGESPGVAGVVKVVREAYPDFTAWEPGSEHFDSKASPDNPIWQMVDVQLVNIFERFVPLAELRGEPKLQYMELLKKGSRLSVQPVSEAHFQHICALGGLMDRRASPKGR